MDKRKINCQMTKVGGNASKNAMRCMVALPMPWITAMGITKENRAINISFDGTKITIEKYVE